ATERPGVTARTDRSRHSATPRPPVGRSTAATATDILQVMLRIHLGPADLARLICDAVPHLDVATSVRILHGPRTSGFVETWRRATLPRVPRDAGPLLNAVPGDGPIPTRLIDYRAIDTATAPADLVA